jgi:hypothetical protein
MKRISVYCDDNEYLKIKYASEKDNRTTSNFLKVAGLKRSEVIIEQCREAGVNVNKELEDLSNSPVLMEEEEED